MKIIINDLFVINNYFSNIATGDIFSTSNFHSYDTIKKNNYSEFNG
jgi:hypothetical protein